MFYNNATTPLAVVSVACVCVRGGGGEEEEEEGRGNCVLFCVVLSHKFIVCCRFVYGISEKSTDLCL